MNISWDDETDVVVMGSGAAGMAAALTARHAGADVLVLERTDKFGGTSAMSGGILWIPNNDHMGEVGSSDTREQAIAYLSSMALGSSDHALIERFVDVAPEALRFIEDTSGMHFNALRMPDYHAEFPGGNFGRSVIADVVSGKELGALRGSLRPAPNFPIPITPLDLDREGSVASFTGDDGEDNFLASDEMVSRIENDMLGCGAGLIAGLLKSAVQAGVRLAADSRVIKLIMDDGVVAGVEVVKGETTSRIRTRRGVIIASGGFERNDALVKQFLSAPLEAAIGSPGCEGDGLIMAMEVGAALTNMAEAWWTPVQRIAGEEVEGRPFSRPITIERALPGAIMVNRKGDRFVNEACNYNDVTRVLHAFDPVTFSFGNLPAWLIMHQKRLDDYPYLTRFPSDPIPDWLIQAPTIRELAEKIGVDADGLERTVARFNENAAKGEDPDFDRGKASFDCYTADPSKPGAFATLAPLDQAPFYAMQVFSGSIGTKGGPKTNVRAQVLSVRGEPIHGLFAAGNAMGSFSGMAYPGAGGTLGPAITFGYIAGRVATGGNV